MGFRIWKSSVFGILILFIISAAPERAVSDLSDPESRDPLSEVLLPKDVPVDYDSSSDVSDLAKAFAKMEKSKEVTYTKFPTKADIYLQSQFLEQLSLLLYYNIVLPTLRATLPDKHPDFITNEIIETLGSSQRHKRSTKSVSAAITVSPLERNLTEKNTVKNNNVTSHYTSPTAGQYHHDQYGRGDLFSPPSNPPADLYSQYDSYNNFYGGGGWGSGNMESENNTITARLQELVKDLTEAYKNETLAQRFLITAVITILFSIAGLALLLWSPYVLLIGIYGLRIILYVKDRNSGTMIS